MSLILKDFLPGRSWAEGAVIARRPRRAWLAGLLNIGEEAIGADVAALACCPE